MVRYLSRSLLCAAAVFAACGTSLPAAAQTGTGGLGDLSDLLQQFGGLGGLTGDAGTNGTSDPGTPTDPDTPTSPGEGLRSPIVTNNFDAHRGPALQERAPSLMLQNSVTILQGDLSSYTEQAPEPTDPFYLFAVKEIVRSVLDNLIQGAEVNPLGNILSSFGSLFGGPGGLGGLGGTGSGNLGSLFQDPALTPIQQGDLAPLENAATSGQGTVRPIN